MTAYWCEYAHLGEGPAPSVRIVEDDGRITTVEPGAAPAAGDVRLAGVVLPGCVNHPFSYGSGTQWRLR